MQVLIPWTWIVCRKVIAWLVRKNAEACLWLGDRPHSIDVATGAHHRTMLIVRGKEDTTESSVMAINPLCLHSASGCCYMGTVTTGGLRPYTASRSNQCRDVVCFWAAPWRDGAAHHCIWHCSEYSADQQGAQALRRAEAVPVAWVCEPA